ncbi:hypothetical protein CBR_g28771 [Chara braunii]|uniref:Uncharacterized protein n=1 Tax=Chara braunii TaxID=69332 RepID=A0A388L9R4_CHABU|nr:hypothetical protein CBR_g28771 [Chara braunii]|eukprot:GBG79057.1 hypothetical protein CBR_g28771 [Chara braunii]
MVYSLSPQSRYSMRLLGWFEEKGNAFLCAAVSLVALELDSLGSGLSPKFFRSALVLAVVMAASRFVVYVESTCLAGMSCARIRSRGLPEIQPPLSFDERILEGRVIVRRGVFRFCTLLRVVAYIVEIVFISPYRIGSDFDYRVSDGNRMADDVQEFHGVVFLTVAAHLFYTTLQFIVPYLMAFRAGERAMIQRIDASGNVSESRRSGGPFWERLWRNQREMEFAVIYERHLREHPDFTAEDVKNNVDTCGLRAYWFHDYRRLLQMVLLNLPSLSVKCCGWSPEDPLWQDRGKLTMALEALHELSGIRNTDVGPEMADVLQDIPQASRFSLDVDVGRDLLTSSADQVLRGVLRSATNAVGVKEVRLAASIVDRLALGRAVLPWQPWRDQQDADQDRYNLYAYNHVFAGLLLEDLVDLVDGCEGNHGTSANTVAAAEDGKQEVEGKLRLQETALSAICSFAHAASELHAHRGWLRKEPDVPSCRFCNAFTSLGPGDWPLETPVPDFTNPEIRRFIDTIVEALNRPPLAGRLLLNFLKVGKRKPSFQKLLADSIRILAYLLCPRMVYWHSFEMRLKEFPDPLCSMDKLPDSSKVEAALRGLVRDCCEKKHKACLSAFSTLHLAKIFICQNVRDMDCNVAGVLLRCLRYCRRVSGSREIEWFACEVLDTLRDLIATSSPSDKRVICNAIASPYKEWGWHFLLKIEDTKLENHRSRGLPNPDITPVIQDTNPSSDNNTGTWFPFQQRCDASAVGLAADVLEELTNDQYLASRIMAIVFEARSRVPGWNCKERQDSVGTSMETVEQANSQTDGERSVTVRERPLPGDTPNADDRNPVSTSIQRAEEASVKMASGSSVRETPSSTEHSLQEDSRISASRATDIAAEASSEMKSRSSGSRAPLPEQLFDEDHCSSERNSAIKTTEIEELASSEMEGGSSVSDAPLTEEYRRDLLVTAREIIEQARSKMGGDSLASDTPLPEGLPEEYRPAWNDAYTRDQAWRTNFVDCLRPDALQVCHVLLCRVRVERVRPQDSFLKRYWATFSLRVIEPAGNPAWRLACTVKERIYDNCYSADTDG